MEFDVRIRPVKLEDAVEMVQTLNAKDLKNFAFFQEAVTLERQQAFLAEMISSSHDLLFAILFNGKIIGTCGLHEIDWKCKNARLGAMIFSPDNRGRGLGSCALRILIGRAFREFGLHKLCLKVLADNRQSAIMDIHLGFQFEARLRDEYLLEGKYHDMIQLCMFEGEWKEG